MSRLVIVSNRVPPPRERSQLAGGLAVALRDAVTGRETLWFGWSGELSGHGHHADRHGPDGQESAPPGQPAPTPQPKLATVGRVTFATIDLAEADYRGFYRGFSNGMLWPLFHYRVGASEFRREDLAAYRRVNDIFAAELAPLLRPGDAIWVHDYHLIPLGAALRRLGVGASRLGFFLHIPFPPRTVYDVLPQGDALLRDFAAYDVLGLQTEEDAANLNGALDAAGVAAKAQAFPIGIDPQAFAAAARRAGNGPEVRRLADSMAGRALILGVDRLDYSKGLPERFKGFARLLKRFPEHRNRVTFLQVAPVSRGDVSAYRSLRRELDELAGRINGEHAEFDWVPLRYLTRAVARNTLAGFQRAAAVGLVTPLRDGMNLVAKEFVAAQNPDEPGALVLSRFAGAAAAMTGAILVNPHDPDEIAEALHAALAMSPEERRARWQTMWEAVQRHTAASWARSFLEQLEGEAAPAASAA
jgi:trehalose 6-phosphate synthase